MSSLIIINVRRDLEEGLHPYLAANENETFLRNSFSSNTDIYMFLHRFIECLQVNHKLLILLEIGNIAINIRIYCYSLNFT